MEEKTMTLEDVITAIDEVFGTDHATEKAPDKQEIFDGEFSSDKYDDRFAGAVAMVMSISTFTGIPLDEVLDMYVEKMREEIEEEDTKALMRIGRFLMDITNK